jgi:MSHA biogenesis protein MshJ
MKEKLLEMAANFDALTRRERITIAVAVLLGGALLGHTLLIEPQFNRKSAQDKRLILLKSEQATVEAQMATMQAQSTDPDANTRAQLEEVRKTMAAMDTRLRNVQDSLVAPEKMQPFLADVLAKKRNLELVSLQTLPAAPLIEVAEGGRKAEVKKDDGAKPVADKPKSTNANAAAVDSAAANIYKHTLEIHVAGHYNDLVAYLAELEGMPQRIIWESVELRVDKHPRCVLILTVYTLNLDMKWLVV